MTACIAILIALVAACGPAVSRTGRDRDRVLRTTRVGPQRTDALEGAHGLDEADGTAVVAVAQVIDGSTDKEEPCATPAAIVPAGFVLPSRAQWRGSPARPAVCAFRSAALDAHAPDRAPPPA